VKTGTVHILVVSGFNVGIVAFISMLFLKVLRVARRWRQGLTILVLIAYCLMTGSSNPVMRATVMGVFFLTGFLLEREPDIYNALALAALFILIINPGQLSDIGFQLSFASVIAIVYIYPKLCAFFKIDKLKIGAIKFLAQGFLVSLSAWLGTAGFITYYFRIICPVTVLANIFVVPLATLITLCGFSLVFAGLVLPGFTPYLGAAGECSIALLLRFNAWAAGLPGAYFYPGA
ncbi:MAG: ComEC/Rec2 family competence protein, partial [Candidatus Omnitrophica bacterium]|nr:ComEC/Rec2 family competence protein [Candidatus Omnitrophota bacterium]